ncbi:hypothetical protein [Enterovibrio norvegicus]|uniref:hypothetical protein n=1 Tax=Enterovibrio norvegicus TaxID=188144 RepID=UPI0024B1651A|nr:hypothetical protein [Enterovibrio norvegicus]
MSPPINREHEFDRLKARLLDACEQLAQQSPDWDKIPSWKRPLDAVQFARQQADTGKQLAEDVIAIVLNIDARLREQANRQQGEPDGQ